jgi:hypothetical protein
VVFSTLLSGSVIEAPILAMSAAILGSKENFACIRILYRGSRRKTGDVNVTAIWRERTGNQPFFPGHGSSIQ